MANVVVESIPPLKRTTACATSARSSDRLSLRKGEGRVRVSGLQSAVPDQPLTSILSPLRKGRGGAEDLRLFPARSAGAVSAIPPRAENCAVTIASRGAQAFTKSSRMRFVTASLNARSLRYEAK